ncbi:MAG: hypothetical protein P4L62_05110 [Candidatus Pacebacteria bacterium]|nr:hypothetical protein [Candidatus Paceibacterota bacterium]MDR3583696.1 hypothetical protein [Candidatus Paceibacterota bacterium]
MKKIKKNTLSIFGYAGYLVFLANVYLTDKVSAQTIPGLNTGTSSTTSLPNVGLPSSSGGIQPILSNFLNWLLGIIGILAIISFVISGFQYFFAATDSKTLESAKRNLTYSIIGIIVALSGYIVIQAINAALSANSTTF